MTSSVHTFQRNTFNTEGNELVRSLIQELMRQKILEGVNDLGKCTDSSQNIKVNVNGDSSESDKTLTHNISVLQIIAVRHRGI